MDYRDDREAMRLRAETLERERDEARRELERLRAEAESPELPTRSPRLWAFVPVLGVLAAIGAFVVWIVPSAIPPAVAPSAATVPADVTYGRSVTAGWSGTVKTATGQALAPGAPCEIGGAFTSDGTSHVTADVNVACGGAAIYRWADPLGQGTSLRQCDVWEGQGNTLGSLHYRLRCQDHGVRTDGRPQLTIDTYAKVITVWQDAPPAWRVEIDVEEFSAPRTGAPLYVGNTPTDPGFRETLERTARVASVSGPSPTPVGASCRVRVEPSGGRHNCRVVVECGGVVLYGATNMGFTTCELGAGSPTRAHDPRGTREEGDAMLEMDLPAGRVVVSDDPASGAWSATLALDPPTGTAPAP